MNANGRKRREAVALLVGIVALIQAARMIDRMLDLGDEQGRQGLAPHPARDRDAPGGARR